MTVETHRPLQFPSVRTIGRLFMLLIPLMLCGAVSDLAAQTWTLTPLDRPFGGLTHHIVSSEDGTLYVGEENTGLNRSTDNGVTWHALYPGTTRISPLAAFDDGLLFGRYSNQMLMRLNPGAGYWKRSEFYGYMNGRYIHDMVIVDEMLMIGTENGLGYSNDFGESYVRKEFVGQSVLRLEESQGTIAGFSSPWLGEDTVDRIFRSFDTGVTWQSIEFSRYSLSGSLEMGGGRILFFADRGPFANEIAPKAGLYEWMPESDTLTPLIIYPGRLHDAVFTVDGQGSLLFAQLDSLELFYFDRDGNEMFRRSLPGWGESMTDLHIAADGSFIAATDYEGIFRSADSGRSWWQQGIVSGTWFDHLIGLPDGDLVGYLFGRGLYRMNKDGEWSRIGTTQVGGVQIDENGTWWGTHDTTLYRSLDEGVTWVAVGETGTKTIGSITTVPAMGIFLTSSNGVRHSTDKGLTWASLIDDQSIEYLQVSPEGDLWAVGYDYIGHSTDTGRTWEERTITSFGTPWAFPELLTITQSGTILFQISGIEGPLYRSTDRGGTWSTYLWPCDFAPYTIASTKDGLIAFADCGLFRSIDDGMTWSLIGEIPETVSSAIVVEKRGGGYYVGTNAGLYLLEMTTSVDETEVLVPDAINLR